jgi:hypothetical protein
MSSEIIQNVAYYDNYDDFQHVKFIFFTKFHFTILRIIWWHNWPSGKVACRHSPVYYATHLMVLYKTVAS